MAFAIHCNWSSSACVSKRALMSSALNGHTDWKSIKIRAERQREEERDGVIKERAREKSQMQKY